MDSHRAVGTYKLFGNESSFSDTTVFLHRDIISISTPSHGQCHSDCIPEQDGRQPFPLLIRSGQGSLDVVHQKESNHSCRTSTRVGEYLCRLGEPTPYRFQQLEITQEDFSKSGQETGSLLNRFICLQDKYPIATVLQLEARSRSTGCGCPVNIMGKPPSLHVSPIRTDSLLLDQASQRENISGDYSSSVAQSNLVPTITEQSGGHPNPLTTNPRYCDESHGTESPISNTGSSFTSRMASFRSIHAGGLSE